MSISAKNVMLFIDPSHSVFYDNELFKATSKWNRDGQFAPFILLKERLAEKGVSVNTADYLLDHQIAGRVNIYISFGLMTNYKKLSKQSDVSLQSFYILEPPVVVPQLYREMDSLSRCFDRVYVHNTDGIGYERYFSNQPNLRQFFWPQVQNAVIEKLWENRDRSFLMMINSNKKSRSKDHELYSERIRALVALQSLGKVDLYGHGWDVPFYKIRKTRHLSYLYWKRRKVLRSIYKGTVESKYETLARYTFAICFENMIMPGYVTEKIFDCFFVGTTPIYLGAPDIEKYVPKGCFIDMRDFSSYHELYTYLLSLSDKDISSFREAAREYLSSEQYQPFKKETFVEQFEKDLLETLRVNGVDPPKLWDISRPQYPRGGKNE